MATGSTPSAPQIGRPPKLVSIIVLAVFILGTIIPTFIGFYTDWLWFGEVDFRSILLGFIPAAIVALCIALVPAFSKVSPFSWFIAAPLGALCYWIVQTLRGNKPLPAGSGD